MGEAIAEVVREAGGEDLGFIFQTAKGTGINNAVAITLKRIARRVFGFRIAAAAGLIARKPQMTQHSVTGRRTN